MSIATTEAPVREASIDEPEPWLTPEQKLRVLERDALRLGMSAKELERIQAIGDCDSQILDRIDKLQEWISTHRSQPE